MTSIILKNKEVIVIFLIGMLTLVSHSQPMVYHLYKIEFYKFSLLIFLLIILYIFFTPPQKIILTVYDLAVIFLFLTIGITFIINYNNKSDLDIVENTFFGFVLYFPIRLAAAKSISDEMRPLFAFFLASMLYIIILNAIIFSTTLTNVYGNMYNSTYFSNYLTLFIPLLHFIYKKSNLSKIRSLILILILLIISLSFLNQARASIIATILYFCCHINFNIIKRKPYHVFVAIALLLIFIYFLINYKFGSTNGRLIIWEYCLHIFSTNPFGIGLGNFKQNFAVYQSSVLDQNFHIPAFLLSDINDYAFNDFIQFTIEGGVFVLVLILYFALLVSISKNKDLVGFSLLVLVISSTSYILHSFPTLLVILFTFCIIINNSNANRRNTFMLSKSIIITILVIAVLWSSFGLMVYHVKRNESNSNLLLTFRGFDNKYLYDWAVIEFSKAHYRKSILLLNKSGLEDYDIDANIMLGFCYEKIGNLKLAELHYLKSSKVLPRIFKPKYNLLHFYLRNNLMMKAKNVCKEIINTPVKVPSKEIFDLKSQATLILEKY